jgi:flavin-dependent dehydrogenase
MAEACVDADVCVIGGGPAGAALACRLAVLGHSVVVIERHAFPRRHVGESVSPGVWPLLELLGVRDRVEAAAFRRSVEARVRWGRPEELRRSPASDPPLTVDRGAFDAVLLSRARDAGATVLQPATAHRPVATPRGWEVAAGARMVRARYLADASGRRRASGGRRRRTSAATVCVHALWRGDVDGAETRVDAVSDAWFWGARLPDGTFRAMAFVDTASIRARRAAELSLERIYRDLLASSPLFADLCDGRAQLAGAIAACDATCFADESPIHATAVKVGEAAFAIDPLSSSGVQTAIQSGVAAGAAVHSILMGGERDSALEYYRDHAAHAVRHHRRLAARSYADCAAYAGAPFWRRRAFATEDAHSPAPPAPAPAPLNELLPGRTRLAPEAALVATACVVGDRVERRRALTHPALERPVAYLGGNELAPLLDRLDGRRSLERVVNDWGHSIPLATAYQVADWLARHGLLEHA